MGSERLLLLYFRYIVHALFVICNAIICCVAVYTLGLSQTLGHNSSSIIFLIFLGALGLAWAIPILFIDVFVRRPVTGRVWVECASLGFFWIFELAGAAAFSANVPSYMCTARAQDIVEHACSATHALAVFTWLCTLLLSFYLMLLVSCAVFHRRHDPAVWTTGVRDFPWFSSTKLAEDPRATPSGPPPALPAPPPLVLHAPQPRRIIPRLRAPVMSFISRTSDRLSSAPTTTTTTTREDHPPPASAPAPRLPSPPPASSGLYPEHVQLALRAIVWDKPAETAPAPRAAPRAPAPARLRSDAGPSSIAMPPAPAPTGGASNPLGDWPRADVLHQPLRPRKKPPAPPSAFPLLAPVPASADEFAPAAEVAVTPGTSSVPPSPRGSFSSGRPAGRPSGPRSRQNSVDSSMGGAHV